MPTVDGVFRWEGGTLEGQLSWSQRCRLQLATQVTEERVLQEQPRHESDIVLIVVGAAMVLLAAPNVSAEEKCVTRGFETTCSDPSVPARAQLLSGAGIMVGGLLGFTRKPSEPYTVLDTRDRQQLRPEASLCSTRHFQGVVLKLRLGDLELEAPVDPSGSVRFAVPTVPTGGVAGGKVTVHSAPAELDLLLPAGTVIGTVPGRSPEAPP